MDQETYSIVSGSRDTPLRNLCKMTLGLGRNPVYSGYCSAQTAQTSSNQFNEADKRYYELTVLMYILCLGYYLQWLRMKGKKPAYQLV